MDILDIVNNVVSRKQETRLEENWDEIVKLIKQGKKVEAVALHYNIDSTYLTTKLSEKNIKVHAKDEVITSMQEIVSSKNQNRIPLDLLKKASYKLFKGNSLYKIAKELKVDSEVLERELENNNFIKRWIVSNSFKLSEVPKELNTNNKTLLDVSNELNIDLGSLRKGLKEVWILETNRSDIYSYSKITKDLTIVTSVEDGRLICIEYKNKRLIISLQINMLLGINTGYYYNLHKDKFFQGMHLIKIAEEELEQIKFSVPYLDYLKNMPFYTQKGLELFATITRKESIIPPEKIIEYFEAGKDMKSTLKEKATPKEDKEISIEEIVNFLNAVDSVSKAEEKFGIKSYDIRPMLKSNGYIYDSLFKKWTTKSRKELLTDIAIQLKLGTTTFDKLEENGILVKHLRRLLEVSGLDYYYVNESSMPISTQIEEESFPVAPKNEEPLSSVEMNFSTDEQKIIRQMIKEWQNNNVEKEDSERSESTFFINKTLLNKLELFSVSNNVSRTSIVEEALENFFDKKN